MASEQQIVTNHIFSHDRRPPLPVLNLEKAVAKILACHKCVAEIDEKVRVIGGQIGHGVSHRHIVGQLPATGIAPFLMPGHGAHVRVGLNGERELRPPGPSGMKIARLRVQIVPLTALAKSNPVGVRGIRFETDQLEDARLVRGNTHCWRSRIVVSGSGTVFDVDRLFGEAHDTDGHRRVGGAPQDNVAVEGLLGLHERCAG